MVSKTHFFTASPNSNGCHKTPKKMFSKSWKTSTSKWAILTNTLTTPEANWSRKTFREQALFQCIHLCKHARKNQLQYQHWGTNGTWPHRPLTHTTITRSTKSFSQLLSFLPPFSTTMTTLPWTKTHLEQSLATNSRTASTTLAASTTTWAMLLTGGRKKILKITNHTSLLWCTMLMSPKYSTHI